MGFVDGGYLREQSKLKTKSNFINFKILKSRMETTFSANCSGKYRGDVIRVYNYDAIVDSSDPKFQEQKDRFSAINNIDGLEIRLGRLIKTGENKTGNYKQKGVDVRLAVDMVSKAYQDQYDFALLLAGDNDFLDVVEAVKDSGKRVFGFYFKDHVSEELLNSFDLKHPVDNFVNDLIQI